MPKRLRLLLPLLLLGCALAANAKASEDDNMGARVQLAAANAPGDLISDAYLARMIDFTLEIHAHDDSLDPTLRDELVRTRDKLQNRVAEGFDDEPVLLATLADCLGRRIEDKAGCDAKRARLAELAGDNGYHHFILMGQAAHEGDEQAFAHHGGKVLEAPDFEPDMVPVFASLYQRYRQVPPALWVHPSNEYGPDSTAGILAMGQAAAVALPAYQQILRGCEGAQDEKRRLCAGVARRMAERSSLLMDRSVALAILRKVGSPDDLARAEALTREQRWLHAGAMRMDDALGDSEFAEYFDIFAREGEFAAMRYANIAMGRAVEPPADWQP